MNIQLLKPEDIEVRPQQINQAKKGASLLLYKDARCDMRILDETFGVFGWQREHYECKGNLFCKVGVKTEDGEWIWKSDCGSESNMEKEKGEASDSFKRACFNLGIGRELYTAPFIWVKLEDKELEGSKLFTKFAVKEITYTADRRIDSLIIVDGTGKVRFSTKKSEQKEIDEIKNSKATATKVATIVSLIDSTKTEKRKLLAYFDVSELSDMTEEQAIKCIKMLESKMKR